MRRLILAAWKKKTEEIRGRSLDVGGKGGEKAYP